jgi:hypothetical protein
LQTLTLKTEEALASDSWLTVGLETVQEFLKVDKLDIDEADLVRAVIRWGKFQLQSEGGDPEKLRAKFLPALQLIRFSGMRNEDVVNICSEELAAVLTAEEKINIFKSCLLKNDKRVARSKKIEIPAIVVPDRLVHLVKLPYKKYKKMGNYENKPFSYRMEFRADQYSKLVGVIMAKTGTSVKRTTFFFTIFKSKSGTLLACGDSDTFLDHSTYRCLKASPEVFLRPGCYISIQFTFPLISRRSGLITGKQQFALTELDASNGKTSVTLTGGMPVLFLLDSLVFD